MDKSFNLHKWTYTDWAVGDFLHTSVKFTLFNVLDGEIAIMHLYFVIKVFQACFACYSFLFGFGGFVFCVSILSFKDALN